MSDKCFVLYANQCKVRAALLDSVSGAPAAFMWLGVTYSERVLIDQFHHIVDGAGQLNGFIFDLLGRNENLEKAVSGRLNACPGVFDDSGTLYVRLVDAAKFDHDGSSVIGAYFFLNHGTGIIACLPWMSEWGMGASKWPKLWNSLGFEIETQDVPVPIYGNSRNQSVVSNKSSS